MKSEDGLEEAERLMQQLDTDDVGQKRYLMYQVFETLLDEVHGGDVEVHDRVSGLRDGNGYMYKLAQEFLTSSSTVEKERKLEDMIDHVSRGTDQRP